MSKLQIPFWFSFKKAMKQSFLMVSMVALLSFVFIAVIFSVDGNVEVIYHTNTASKVIGILASLAAFVIFLLPVQQAEYLYDTTLHLGIHRKHYVTVMTFWTGLCSLLLALLSQTTGLDQFIKSFLGYFIVQLLMQITILVAYRYSYLVVIFAAIGVGVAYIMAMILIKTLLGPEREMIYQIMVWIDAYQYLILGLILVLLILVFSQMAKRLTVRA